MICSAFRPGGLFLCGPLRTRVAEHGYGLQPPPETAISKGQMILRPGWVRLNFNYFFDQETVDYLVRAVMLIAEHGWRLLPYYHYSEDPAPGVFRS